MAPLWLSTLTPLGCESPLGRLRRMEVVEVEGLGLEAEIDKE